MTRTRTPSGTTRAAWAALAATALALTAVGTSSAPAASPPTRPVAAVPVAQAPKAECTQTYSPSTSAAGIQEIRRRGRLIVGTSGDVILWGARNPDNGRLEGFDIDLSRELAREILGNPNAVEFRVINYAQRIPALQNGSVDLVLHTMTINCERWEQVNFSSVYYNAGQKLLVRDESSAPVNLDAFREAGLKICVAKGSTNLQTLESERYKAIARVEVDDLGECLVRFQQGVVDGITGDDTVLAGFAVQDPYAKVVGPPLTAEPYGIGVKKENVDLVRYVNAVLDELRENGTWSRIYAKTMGPVAGPATPPPPTYGRTG